MAAKMSKVLFCFEGVLKKLNLKAPWLKRLLKGGVDNESVKQFEIGKKLTSCKLEFVFAVKKCLFWYGWQL